MLATNTSVFIIVSCFMIKIYTLKNRPSPLDSQCDTSLERLLGTPAGKDDLILSCIT
jgi:hypothetical protein